jgi:hypothetical protein
MDFMGRLISSGPMDIETLTPGHSERLRRRTPIPLLVVAASLGIPAGDPLIIGHMPVAQSPRCAGP